MRQTAVEWLWDMLLKGEFINNPEELFEQAKAKERSQKAEEYLKGFKDGAIYCTNCSSKIRMKLT